MQDDASPNTDKKNEILKKDKPAKQLFVYLDALRSNLKIPASNAKCLRILQEIPCLLRCANDLREAAEFNGHIDPIFKLKHDYAKTKIIDAILQKISNDIVIKSEFNLGTGSLDIAILQVRAFPDESPKLIGIEIKSGKSIDLHQLERYLYECDTVILVRVITEDVAIIRNSLLVKEIRNNILSLIEKTKLLINGNRTKIEGQWCRECSAQCEFRKRTFNNAPITAPIYDIDDFIRKVSIVAGKVVVTLTSELAQQNGNTTGKTEAKSSNNSH